ncbi:hypothetical protein VTK26DRAFT_7076 [Humicola hyalothermophila]
MSDRSRRAPRPYAFRYTATPASGPPPRDEPRTRQNQPSPPPYPPHGRPEPRVYTRSDDGLFSDTPRVAVPNPGRAETIASLSSSSEEEDLEGEGGGARGVGPAAYDDGGNARDPRTTRTPPGAHGGRTPGRGRRHVHFSPSPPPPPPRARSEEVDCGYHRCRYRPGARSGFGAYRSPPRRRTRWPSGGLGLGFGSGFGRTATAGADGTYLCSPPRLPSYTRPGYGYRPFGSGYSSAFGTSPYGPSFGSSYANPYSSGYGSSFSSGFITPSYGLGRDSPIGTPFDYIFGDLSDYPYRHRFRSRSNFRV